MCWLVPKNLQNTIPSYSSVYVRLSEGNADPLKASQETSRTHWKDICGVEVDPQSTRRKVRGHFCLSRVLSVQLFVSPSLPLSPLFLCLLVSVSQLFYAHLFKSPSFPPSQFSSPSQLQPAHGFALLCCGPHSTPRKLSTNYHPASHFPFLREACGLGTSPHVSYLPSALELFAIDFYSWAKIYFIQKERERKSFSL